MRGDGTLEGFARGHEASIRKEESWRTTVLMSGEQPARVVEMQVRQDDGVDPFVTGPDLRKCVQERVARIKHAIAFAQFRGEECADPRLEQGEATSVFKQEAAACEVDSPKVVGHRPTLPERPRGVAKHRSTVEPLTIAFEGPDASHGHHGMPPNVPGIDESLPFVPCHLALMTVSDSRTEATDLSGAALFERATAAGHLVRARCILPDDIERLVSALDGFIADPNIDVVLMTGGTGLTGRDVTPEAVRRVIDKEIPGFGELFRWLSYQKIGTSTIQSRALGGVARGTYVFALPGSPSACRDAWDGILATQLDRRYRPCNFIELIPRLREA